MTWNEVQDSTMCITPDEWNTMVDYIEANTCQLQSEVTFYLYSDCSNSTGQKFKFDFSGDDSHMYGGDTSGQDLFLHSNSSNTYPFIQLTGDGEIELNVKNVEEIVFNEGGDQFFLFDRAVTNSKLHGGSAFTSDLSIFANSSADGYPLIFLEGRGNIELDTYADILFKEQGAEMFKMTWDGASTCSFYGADANGDDMDIIANSADGNGQIFLNTGTDVVKFGAHTALGGESLSGFITIKDKTGATRKIAVIS